MIHDLIIVVVTALVMLSPKVYSWVKSKVSTVETKADAEVKTVEADVAKKV